MCMCVRSCACLEGERECLQSMAKVQQSNSFRKEAVSEPGGLTPDAPQPSCLRGLRGYFINVSNYI